MEITTANQPAVNHSRRRRRRYVVKAAFQWKYAAVIVAGVFLVSLFMSYVLFGILYQQARARTLYPPATTDGEIALVVVLCALAFSAAPALALGLWGIVVTHRICGPIFVMESYLTRIIEGRFPERRPLRKKDEFKDFYDLFWQAVDLLRARKQADLTALSEILDIAESAVDADDQTRMNAIESITTGLESLCAQTARTLGAELDAVSAAQDRKPRSSDRTVRQCAEVCP